MIDYKLFDNFETTSEGVIQVQDEIKGLEQKIADLEASNSKLKDTNQRLFLRVTGNKEPEKEPEVEPEVEKTEEDYLNELIDKFWK